MATETDDAAQPVPRPLAQRGKNQSGIRDFNERLVLGLVRRHGSLSKSAITRMTGLSAQTVSVIMRRLESDHLLQRGEPMRGRVGQPSVPLSIDPDGAYFIGAKVGRRSLDLVLVDFGGGVRHEIVETYPYPTPRDTIRRIRAGVDACAARLGADAERIAGLGVAMPSRLWAWADEIGARAVELEAWREYDLRADLDELLPYPVYLQNDATAACGAELVFGGHAGLDDFLYFHVGAFVGGGVVLGGALYAGRSGNAGAVGSCPVPDGRGGTVPLFERASLILLERALHAAGRRTDRLYDPAADWHPFGRYLDAWIGAAGDGIAHAVAAAASVIDFEAAVVDGSFPPDVRERLLRRIGTCLGVLDLTGIDPPRLLPGSIGPPARALGGASLPLFDRYLLDHHALAGDELGSVRESHRA
jgi:predicted NBD/HSP70 family sugar kinase